MPDNLIIVGAQFNGSEYKAGMDAAAASTERSTQQMRESFDKVNASSHEAMAGMAFAVEDTGIKVSRHFRTMLAEIPLVNAAFKALMPAFAIGVGIEILGHVVEKIKELREEDEKLARAQTTFGTEINNTFNSLDEKLLQAGIHSDDLNNNHLRALKKQLELIDLQSMAELSHSFDVIAKGADRVFAELKSHWYAFGIGSEGAQHALLNFQTQYDSLLARGKDKDASNLLLGTKQTAEYILAMMHQAQASMAQYENGVLNAPTRGADIVKFQEAENALKAAGVGLSEKEVKSQQALVDALNAQVEAEGKIASLKQTQVGNDKENALQKSIADNIAKIADDKKTADAQMQLQRAAIQTLHQEKVISDEQALELNRINLEAQYRQDEQALQNKLAQLRRDPSHNANLIKAVQAEIQSLQAQHLAAMDKLNGEYALQVEKNGKEAVTKAAASDNKVLENLRGSLEARMKAVKEENDGEIKLQELAVENEFNQGKISKRKELAQLAELKAQALQIDINYLRNRQQLYAKGSKEYEHIEAEITKDKQQQAALRKKADVDEANNFTAQVRRQLKSWQDMDQQLSQSFTQTISSLNSSLSSFIVEGQANWKQFAAGAIESILQIGLQYAESKLLMMLFDKLGNKTKLQLDAESGIAEVEIAANVGAANAYAAFAAFPLIAAGAAAAAFTAISGFSTPIAAFAKFDVGTNYVPMDGLAMLHKGEQIIPASGQGPGYSAGAGRGGNITFNFNSTGSLTDQIKQREFTQFKNMMTKELEKMGFKRK